MTAPLAGTRLEEAQLDAYLARVSVSDRPPPIAVGLRQLHVAHLLRVPFESLDIHLGRPISLEIRELCRKIIEERRGGFCYEQNLLFAAVLRTLGFEVEVMQAQVRDQRGGFGRPFDHVTIRVLTDEGPCLADVGFGECFRDPLPMNGSWHLQPDGSSYRVVGDGPASRLEHRDTGGEGVRIDYRLDPTPRAASEFLPMCRFHQSSEASPFTRSWICSLATPRGRITLKPGWLTESIAGRLERQPLRSQDELQELLRDRFGMSGLRLPDGFTWSDTG